MQCESARTPVGFEMKAATKNSDDFKHLRWFRDKGAGSTWDLVGVVIYLGDCTSNFGTKMFALPLSTFRAISEALIRWCREN